MDNTTQEKKRFSRFDLGFISKYDLNELEAPSNALADVQNFEINAPLAALKSSQGSTLVYGLPDYSGSRMVAFNNWGIDSPAVAEPTVLIMSSSNLLLHSEDFESADWTWTLGGATLTPNFSASPQGIRVADKLTGMSGTTKVLQALSATALTQCKGHTVTFSIYFKGTGVDFNINIIEAGGSHAGTSTYLVSSIGSDWTRYTISRAIASDATSVTIQIDGLGSVTTLNLWGAQAEVSVSATGYGYTFNYIQPYYIFIRQWYDGTVWNDTWLELTERRAGKQLSHSAEDFIITGLDGADDYYNNWYIHKPASGGGLIANYVAGSQTLSLTNNDLFSNGDFLELGRSVSFFDTEYQYLNVTEKNISFLSIYNTLRISFGNITRPLLIKYSAYTVFSGITNPVTKAGYILDYLCHMGQGIFGFTVTDYEGAGVLSGSGDPVIADSASGGTLTPGLTYRLYVVMVIDGNQRYPVWEGSHTMGGGKSAIDITPWISAEFFSPRLTAIEIYIGESTALSSDATGYYYSVKVNTSVAGWVENNTAYTLDYTLTVSGIDTVQSSLFLNLGGRPPDCETRAKFNIQKYLLGRIFIANVPEGTAMIRFSNINGLTEELDVFAYTSDGYGYLLIESGIGEQLKALGISIENDLLICKSRSTHVYQIQSGNATAKRLRQLFTGIGANSQRSLVSSDVGNFWYDYNDIYWYQGGYSNPVRISEGKIRQWWRRLNQANIDASFSLFNRALNEFWIVIDDGISLITYLESVDVWRSDTGVAVSSGSTYIPFNSALINTYSLFVSCYKVIDGEKVTIGFEAPNLLQLSTGFTVIVDEDALVDYQAVPIVDSSQIVSDLKILRFSPEFTNWNIWRPAYNPVWLGDKISGEFDILTADSIYKYGGLSAKIAPFALTHKVKLSGYRETLVTENSSIPKQLEEVFLDQDSSANITMEIIIDNETYPRSGNSPVFLAAHPRKRAAIRAGSSVNYITINLVADSTDSVLIREFGTLHQTRTERVGTRK